MIDLLEKYIAQLTHLKQGVTKYGKAPHKPVLLISVFEMIDNVDFLKSPWSSGEFKVPAINVAIEDKSQRIGNRCPSFEKSCLFSAMMPFWLTL